MDFGILLLYFCLPLHGQNMLKRGGRENAWNLKEKML